MKHSDQLDKWGNVFPVCRSVLGPRGWNALLSKYKFSDVPVASFKSHLNEKSDLVYPDYLTELAKLEWAIHRLKSFDNEFPDPTDYYAINPSLEIIPLTWKLISLFNDTNATLPKPGNEMAVIWKDPESDKINIDSASERDLLALKIISESIPLDQVTSSGELSKYEVNNLLRESADRGLLISPRSRIQRTMSHLPGHFDLPVSYLSSNYFTIQWHITHKCDLNCKHCYDRSKRSPLTKPQGFQILDDLIDFSEKKNVRGHVCFTGGNPFLHPDFFDLYKAAVERGLSTSVLGNPVQRGKIQKLVEIQSPEYYQVSLEGLQEHNDCIRGKNNFNSVIRFLGVLREFDISSAVMLTLTRDNLAQILPLAEQLRGHTDQFTFNRLSQVGEGASLLLPNKTDYLQFLKEYLDETEINPILGLKDNLINAERMRRGIEPFGGCTGFGCGAAFSFIAILPDGEVHACRKFPSAVGNVLEEGLMAIYESAAAEQYRKGCEACLSCRLKPVCGGCLAITHSIGEDIFTVKDPFCDFNG